MNRQKTVESAACASSSGDGMSENPLHVFVTLVMIRVLHKVGTLKNCSQDERSARIKHLVKQTTNGLSLKSFRRYDQNTIKTVYMAVLKDLQNMVGGKCKLESAALLQPQIDEVIVHALQAHIHEANKKYGYSERK